MSMTNLLVSTDVNCIARRCLKQMPKITVYKGGFFVTKNPKKLQKYGFKINRTS